jgi:tetratricopeptide (TPR) repeat protein
MLAAPLTPRRLLAAMAVAALALASGGGLPSMAGDEPRLAQSAPEAAARARKLDELFARLKAVKDEQEADAIVSEIWKLWQQSGDADLDEKMHQAILLMGQGIGTLAMPILDEIVKRLPDWAEGWNKRATMLYLMGEHERSLADIERVLALEPRHFGALAGIGLIRMDKGEYREALAAFRRALAVNPFLKERHGIIPALEKEIGERPL